MPRRKDNEEGPKQCWKIVEKERVHGFINLVDDLVNNNKSSERLSQSDSDEDDDDDIFPAATSKSSSATRASSDFDTKLDAHSDAETESEPEDGDPLLDAFHSGMKETHEALFSEILRETKSDYTPWTDQQ